MRQTRKSFYSKPSSFSNTLFFDVGSTLILIQRESEKTFWKADFEVKNYNASGFELKKLKRVRFRIGKFTTRQILN